MEVHCPDCGEPLARTESGAAECRPCLLRLALAGTASEPARIAPDTTPGDGDPGAAEDEFIGPYRVVRPLGAGGMGDVYLAEQTGSIRRPVAVKVVKRGMDTRAVIARFESERQALALMDHPTIARVFAAGETRSGRPYFSMEYVEGQPITAWADSERLTVRERLELFVQVCDGVQHAHQKGILHRDLKPSNILVTRVTGGALPKIIDFGVAKATERRLTEHTLCTEMGVLIGTPEYMSPEQADPAALDVDTRADVYSLGVLLYELLTGTLPFDSKSLRSGGIEAMSRRIRTEDPPRPAARLRALAPQAAEPPAHARRTTPAALVRQIEADLDWIVMKALDKDRARRYASPSELAADVRRHLHDEPVVARPPDTLYQIRKLVVRHRTAAAFAATLFVLVAGFGIWMTLLYRRAQANLERAVQAEIGTAKEAATARQVSDFLVRLFAVSDPGEARGNTVTARELLDEAAGRIAGDLAAEPAVQARLMHSMGEVYLSLGLYDSAEPLLRDALARREALPGGSGSELAASLVSLARLSAHRNRVDEGEALARRALAIQEQAGADAAATYEVLGSLARERGDAATAATHWERVLAIRDRPGEAVSEDLARSVDNLGMLSLEMGRFADAEPLLKRALDMRERLGGPDGRGVSATLNNLAELCSRQARYAEAEPLHLRALAIDEKVLGPDHPGVALKLNNLGLFYKRQGRFAEAEPLYQRALQIREKSLGPDHPLVAWTLDNIGMLHYAQKQYPAAEKYFVRALAVAEKAVGPEHPDLAIVLNNLALVRGAEQRYREAEVLVRRTIAIWEKAHGGDHPQVAFGYHNLATICSKTGRTAESERHFRRALQIREKSLPPDHPLTKSTREALQGVLRRAGRTAEADAV